MIQIFISSDEMESPAKSRLTQKYLLNWLQGYISQRPGSLLVTNFGQNKPEIIIEHLITRIAKGKTKKEMANLVGSVTAVKNRRELFRKNLADLDKRCLAHIILVLDSIHFENNNYNQMLDDFVYYDQEAEEAENLTLLSEHLESLNFGQLRKVIISVLDDEFSEEFPVDPEITDANILKLMGQVEEKITKSYQEVKNREDNESEDDESEEDN